VGEILDELRPSVQGLFIEVLELERGVCRDRLHVGLCVLDVLGVMQTYAFLPAHDLLHEAQRALRDLWKEYVACRLVCLQA
jgi:hypothetical protein